MIKHTQSKHFYNETMYEQEKQTSICAYWNNITMDLGFQLRYGDTITYYYIIHYIILD